jgi:hypothetical protein
MLRDVSCKICVQVQVLTPNVDHDIPSPTQQFAFAVIQLHLLVGHTYGYWDLNQTLAVRPALVPIVVLAIFFQRPRAPGVSICRTFTVVVQFAVIFEWKNARNVLFRFANTKGGDQNFT